MLSNILDQGIDLLIHSDTDLSNLTESRVLQKHVVRSLSFTMFGKGRDVETAWWATVLRWDDILWYGNMSKATAKTGMFL